MPSYYKPQHESKSMAYALNAGALRTTMEVVAGATEMLKEVRSRWLVMTISSAPPSRADVNLSSSPTVTKPDGSASVERTFAWTHVHHHTSTIIQAHIRVTNSRFIHTPVNVEFGADR